MAKTQKFSEDLLLEAVIKYSETCPTKIKATELAKWAKENIEGLEDVRDYHFTRPVQVRDKKGNIVSKQKLCTERIEELNKSRSATSIVNANSVLNTSSLDKFFNMPISQQRKELTDARDIVNDLRTKNARLTRDNDALRRQNNEITTEVRVIKTMIEEYQAKQDKLDRIIMHAFKQIDESSRKEILKEMGVEDKNIDLRQYNKSLELLPKQMHRFDEIINKYLDEEMQPSHSKLAEPENLDTIKMDIMKGLNF